MHETRIASRLLGLPYLLISGCNGDRRLKPFARWSTMVHCLVPDICSRLAEPCAWQAGSLFSCSLHPQAADEKLARAQSRLTERERQSLQAQAAVSTAWARAEA